MRPSSLPLRSPGEIISTWFWAVTVLILLALPYDASARGESQQAEKPVVRAVMFWVDTCGHCHYVLENVLPPLQEKYKDQFDLFLIELVTSEDVDRLFRVAAEYGFSKDQVGVPFLIIGEEVLMGSDQVEARLPGLIETYLAQGGVDYPQAAALEEILPSTEGESASAGEAFTTGGQRIGFVLANAILAGMAAAVFFAVFSILRVKSRMPKKKRRHAAWQDFAIPGLALVGLGVAGYLAYVETQAVPAVCGPLGDCNAVHNSPYARLFGMLPVGVLGLIGYAAVLGIWSLSRIGGGRLAGYASILLFGMAFAGTVFSIYLTYLELYVIRAVCDWCLSSAVIITLLLFLSAKRAEETFVN
jgi:uncharacterized membrane protein